ncbi:hypothetical protein BDV93DRAFT_560680 [Ceratobasidium sp. AG-I]|nr:hypothetical protein BDV93DRAFT_567078 [Ceratobasidium sp. AG-I]KAF8599153.1 hypothetical protein BDV93DRAFT_560680 [Ceratobasidium sp. AG-I]
MSLNAPTQTPDPDTTYPVSLSVVPQPWFWAFITLLSLVVAYFLLQLLAKYGLFLAICPGRIVNVSSSNPRDLHNLERTGRLVLPLPFLAVVWHGRSDGISAHSLSKKTVIRHQPLPIIPLADINRLTPLPPSAPSVPIQPAPAVPQASITAHGDHHSITAHGDHHSILPPGLESSTAPAIFGSGIPPISGQDDVDPPFHPISLPSPDLSLDLTDITD